MSWAAIIAAILQVLGPILVEWLRKWLDTRLARAAEKLGDTVYASEHEARDAMFDQAIADLPHHAHRRRRLLKRMKDAAAAAGVTSAGGILAEADAIELSELAAAAAEE